MPSLRLHFESVIAAVELPVPRGKLKNRTKTFWGNPLCRGVDELCTELLDARNGCVAQLLEHLKRLEVALSENLELKTKEFGLNEDGDR
jgi:hypothetical protein